MSPENKKRVGLFVDSLMGGGAERVALNFAEKFIELGHEARVFVLHPPIEHQTGNVPIHLVSDRFKLANWRPLNKWLYAQRIKLAAPDDYVVLPEVISKEPLGPSVRQGDEEWFDIVRWSLYAQLNAEELGVTSANVEEMAKSTKNPDIARLLGAEGDFGKDLKLPKDWAVQIVKQVGNYGEIFDRNVGAGSELKIERGLNALWNKGGLQYAPPVR